MAGQWRWPALTILACSLVAAGDYLLGTAVTPPAKLFHFQNPSFGPDSFRAQIERSQQRISLGEQRVSASPEDWLTRAGLASALLADFRLTGNLERLSRASDEFATSRSLASGRGGAPLAAADFALATHNLADARDALDRFSLAAVPPIDADKANALSIEGDIAFYSGDLSSAKSLYAQAEQLSPDASIHIRLAELDRSQGKFDSALVRLAEASKTGPRSPIVLAKIALQAGTIESSRGRFSEASKWYQKADALFPDYWLTQLYLAESAMVSGAQTKAIATLEEIAADGVHAEAMDMLALIYRANGERRQSKEWSAKAATVWRERAATFPLAFGAHAAEHELVFGDPAKALQLALQNRDARPYGDARVLLANAYTANGDPQSAIAELNAAETSGWRSATLYAARASAYELLGRMDEAVADRERASAYNPKIFDKKARLVWLAHG